MLELMQDPRWSILVWMTLDILVWSRAVTYYLILIVTFPKLVFVNPGSQEIRSSIFLIELYQFF